MTARSPSPRRELRTELHRELHGAVVAVARSPRSPSTAVAEALEDAGADVRSLTVDRSIADRLAEAPPDVVVIDHSTDDFNVGRLCASVCDAVTAPVLVYTTADHASDEATTELLGIGASAVVESEASTDRLLAQVGAILRLTPPREPQSEPITIGDVTIDEANHRLLIGGSPVPCSPLLRRLLAVLAESPDRPVPTRTLLTRVWGLEATARTQRVRFAIGSLRKLLGAGPERPRIETVPLGYLLATPK